MHIKDNGERIDWPKRMSSYTAERRDNGKYCQFHKDVGHDTEQYNHLKKEIEKLIQAGSLRRFVKSDDYDRSAHEVGNQGNERGTKRGEIKPEERPREQRGDRGEYRRNDRRQE